MTFFKYFLITIDLVYHIDLNEIIMYHADKKDINMIKCINNYITLNVIHKKQL